jgi:hypothetical protein
MDGIETVPRTEQPSHVLELVPLLSPAYDTTPTPHPVAAARSDEAGRDAACALRENGNRKLENGNGRTLLWMQRSSHFPFSIFQFPPSVFIRG